MRGSFPACSVIRVWTRAMLPPVKIILGIEKIHDVGKGVKKPKYPDSTVGLILEKPTGVFGDKLKVRAARR